jgi:peptidoglycan hydrolase CwlO-like protein
MLNRDGLIFLMTVTGTLCWGGCFWWMHRISAKQNSLLDRLHEQAQRIEKLSRVEHDLIKEVHPQVGEIKQGVEEMMVAVKETAENQKDIAEHQKEIVEVQKEIAEHQSGAAAPGP